MHKGPRPHVLGIDDGPVDKRSRAPVPVVGVMMEGADLVEAVAITRFPVDGAGATEFLAGWVSGLRLRPALQAVVVGGITIAGLGVLEVERLSLALRRPVLVVNRRAPANAPLVRALERAGLKERQGAVERTPPAHAVGPRLFVAAAGMRPEEAVSLVRAMRRKSELPEALRIAHLVARAVSTGESRGRP
jgi:endonuclease V-like protein UPF0215 family